MPHKTLSPHLESSKKNINFFASKLVRKLPFSSWEKEDFVQELTIALWKAHEDFDPAKGSWGAFSRHVLQNTYKEILRRHFTKKRQNDASITYFDEEKFSSTEDQEKNYEVKQNFEYLKKFLSKKELALLEDLETLSISEISKKNSEPVNTLYWRLHNLRKKTKAFFKKK